MKKLWHLLELLSKGFVVLLPWRLKRRLLQSCWGYELHPTAAIGWSWVYPGKLVMAEHSSIGHGNVIIHLDRVEFGESATMARGNWVTGYPGHGAAHFCHQTDRHPELLVGKHSAITKNHHLDCTDAIRIGDFSTVAGYGSQFLTHSIDLVANRQNSRPIMIGSYTFVGTQCTVLGGAKLPDRCVLGAKSLLNRAFDEACMLYAGVPARPVKAMPEETAYFHRTTGFVA